MVLMKLISLLGGVQQETTAKNLTPCLDSASDCKRLNTHLYFIIINFRREQPSGKRQLSHKLFNIYIGRNVWLIINN